MKLHLLAIFLLLPTLINAACDQDGLSIMKAQESKQKVKFEYEDQQIVLLDMKSNIKENRTLRHFTKKSKSGQERALLTFMTPVDIKGSAVLNWRESDSEDQWVYLPGLKKLQRIASGSKRKYFMGTDFTFADLEGEVIKNYNYSCQKMRSCPDKKSKCYQIAATPKSKDVKRTTGYTKRILLVEKKRLITHKVNYYNMKGKLFKMALYNKWIKEGKVWRPNLATMTRGKKHKTYIKVIKRTINKKIEDIIFSKRYIEKEMHTK